SGQMRLDIWNEGLRMIQENPITGVGYNRFQYELHRKDIGIREPHNAYIKIASEMGIPALIWFIVMLFAALACTFGTRPGIHRELANAFTGFWFAFVAVNLFGNRILREGLICYFMVFCGIMVLLRTAPFAQDGVSETQYVEANS